MKLALSKLSGFAVVRRPAPSAPDRRLARRRHGSGPPGVMRLITVPTSSTTDSVAAPPRRSRDRSRPRRRGSRWDRSPSPARRCACSYEAGLHALRQSRRLERCHRDLLQRQLAIGAGDGERAVGEVDVRLGRLQHVRGELLAFLDHLVRRHRQRRAADHHRARAVRAHAECDAVGVAVDETASRRRSMPSFSCRICLNMVSWPWPWVLGAHQQHRRAARLEADLGDIPAPARRPARSR